MKLSGLRSNPPVIPLFAKGKVFSNALALFGKEASGEICGCGGGQIINNM
jgi:hypothetical protein